MRKKSIISLALVLLMICSGFICSAETVSYAPYKGYEYNDADESQLAPVGYLPEKLLFENGIVSDVSLSGIKSVSTAIDTAGTQWYFMLDAAKNRIIRLNAQFELYAVYDYFCDAAGNKLNISNAVNIGYSFSKSRYLIAYTDNVIVTDASGKFSFSVPCRNAKAVLRNEDIFVSDSDNGYKTYSYDGQLQSTGNFAAPVSAIAYDSMSDSVFAVSGNKVINQNMGSEYIMPFSTANALIFPNNGGDTIYVFDRTSGNVCCVSSLEDGKALGTLPNGAFGFDALNQRPISISGGTLKIYDNELKKTSEIKELRIVLDNPSDMVLNGNSVYILDAGNSRIIELDKTFSTVKRIYSSITDENGNILDFTKAKGMNIAANGDFLIADTENYRMIRSTKDGKVRHIITKPDVLSDDDTPFRVSNVLEDRNGKLYVLTDSINMGAFVFDTDYSFDNYYGSNTVIKTGAVIMNYIKRKFMTRAQIENSTISTPVSIRGFDIDKDGFIYTVSATDQSSFETAEIRKLNYEGKNILETREISDGFGDLEWDRQKNYSNTSFCDILVDDDGFMNLIDQSRGKIFQYSPEGQLVTVYGGLGTQLGLFKEPISLLNIDGDIYVLDKASGNITKFRQTEYSAKLRAALKMLDDADGSKALEAWESILKMNTNSLYPYYGIGIAQQTLGNYKEAMRNFKLCGAKTEYSKAFKLYRKEYIQKNIWWMCLAAVAVIAVIVLANRAFKKKLLAEHGETYSFMESKAGLPFYVLFHPIDGFEQLKYRSLHSWKYSVGAVVAWFLVSVLSFFCTGFAFNANRAIDYNLIMTLCTTVILFIFFVFANWCIASFLDGKGKMKDIIVVTAYALLPMLASIVLKVFLSNVLCIEEEAFIGIIVAIGYVWSGIILVLGMYAIHSYSFSKTVISVVLTAVVVLIITLLIALFFTMMQQVVSFVQSIIYEFRIR